MRKLLVGLTMSIAGLLLVPLSASAAEFETFVGCDALSANPVPAEVCVLGDSPGAFFESDTEVEYEVCVELPNGEELCSEEELAEAAVLYVNELPSSQTGNYFVSWWVEGVEVDFWEFRVDSPPPPPPPPPVITSAPAPAPVISPPPTVPSGPSAACLKARHRVNKLKSQLRKAEGHKRIVKIRAELRGAQAGIRRAC